MNSKVVITGKLVVFVGMMVLLAGCMLGPDFKRPVIESPETYRFSPDDEARQVNLKWWELFEDPVLYSLVITALENNWDLRIAASRIEEARAFLGFIRADLYPRIDLGAGANRGNFAGGTRSSTTNTTLFIAPALSWEIDFWGKFRRASETAKAELFASAYALRMLKFSLVAEVVGTYYLLLDFHNRLEISKSFLNSRIKSLEIIRERFNGGIVPELDVNQAEIQKEIAAAAIPQYERAIARTENALSILLGRPSREIETGKALNRQPIRRISLRVCPPICLSAAQISLKHCIISKHRMRESVTLKH